ncbi:MAG: pilus assembly protein PilM [Verrucomicrobia bacterium]|nr:pilus assembly protein PilM [Verrucomicrobiota bacterium]
MKRIDQVVAIDLGGRQTKAVHIQNKGERLALLGFAIQDLPGPEKADKPLSADALGNHLKNLLKPLGDRTRLATLAVGMPDAFLRHAELPPMPIPDMRQMLKLNSKAYLQQEMPDHVFDCSIIVSRGPVPPTVDASKPAPPSSNLQKQRVLVGGAKRQTLEVLKTACKVAGIAPHQITPGMVGPANALEVAEPEVFAKEVVALVDIGFKNTTITMLRNGELAMNRVVTIGGDRITAGLSESLGISYAEAEGIKLGMPGEVQQHLEPVIASLGRELRASIDFFEHQQDVTVGTVFLSGGTARSEFIVRTLQTELMVPCKVWNPAKSLQLSLPADQMAGLEQAAPQLAVAIGAAIAAF